MSTGKGDLDGKGVSRWAHLAGFGAPGGGPAGRSAGGADPRLIAVGNFWERGECFFRLALQGLEAGRRYLLREPATNRAYADDNGHIAWTAEGLRRGVLLHVGALRCAFFLLEPYRSGMEHGEVVRTQDMAAAIQERLPAIRQALSDD
ncbi:hypothetical protein D4R89_09605 [bacterium]|nr:MAG: hypothetical protein D4R89_09605 [bacterium]